MPLCDKRSEMEITMENENKQQTPHKRRVRYKGKDPKRFEEKYKEFALSKRKTYINRLCGVSPLFKIADKLCGHKLQRRIDKTQRLAIRNYIECEAHRELILEGME